MLPVTKSKWTALCVPCLGAHAGTAPLAALHPSGPFLGQSSSGHDCSPTAPALPVAQGQGAVRKGAAHTGQGSRPRKCPVPPAHQSLPRHPASCQGRVLDCHRGASACTRCAGRTAPPRACGSPALPEEGGGYTQHDCARLLLGVSVVEHVTLHRGLRRDAGPRPRGGDAQVEHGLAAQELPDAGAQDLAAVGLSGIKHRGHCAARRASFRPVVRGAGGTDRVDAPKLFRTQFTTSPSEFTLDDRTVTSPACGRGHPLTVSRTHLWTCSCF